MDLTKSKISLFKEEKIEKEEKIPDEIRASRDLFLPVNNMSPALTISDREDRAANNRKLIENLQRDSQKIRQLMYRR